MINKNDRLKAGLQPLLAKTLENALAHRIAEEFPRIGGPRICKLCAEMILGYPQRHLTNIDHKLPRHLPDLRVFVAHSPLTYSYPESCILYLAS